MLIINKKLTKKGFSLIELMVAVAILAMAIFGIFNAFSSGWMGMANARDRTVATNYAQEILEDIKNTPFEKIHSESTSQIDDTKFSRNINSININPNIKEVTAQVTWKNWRGSVKNVEASTLIYSQFSSKQTSDAVALVLYAQPYHNILPGSSETMLTALVKDVNGNLVTDWDRPIFFSIPLEPVDYSGMGTVPPEGFTPNHGKVTGVIFASSGEFGEAVIVASSEGLRNDSVTLKITDKAVAIKLEADPVTIFTGGQSTINVSLLDANYEDIGLPEGAIDEHLVIFNVIDGPGTITPISVLLHEDNLGRSFTTLTSSGTPGIVTIIASSIDLESGVINVPILGTAKSISITATPSSISLDGDTDITITIKDSAGNPVAYEGVINLTLNGSGEGILTSNTLDYPSVKTTIFTALSTGEVNITATSDVEGELSSDTVTIYIYEVLRIELTANPEIIIAGEGSSSTITATIVDTNNDIVMGGTHEILFEIVSGEGNLSDYITTTAGGVAIISLTPTINPSIITVNARAENLTPDSVTVQSTIPKFISISADPNWLYINEQSNISIDVVDSVGDSVEYEGLINLTLTSSDFGSGSITPESPLYYPDVKTTVFIPLSTGEVTITADGAGVYLDYITIQILEVGETILTFADNITISPDGDGTIVSFDISIWGEPLEIVEMNISWNSSSTTLNKICFSTTGTCFNYDPVVNSGESINVKVGETPTTLSTGVSTISLYFSGDMNGETITVIFYDSSLVPVSYPLEGFTIE